MSVLSGGGTTSQSATASDPALLAAMTASHRPLTDVLWSREWLAFVWSSVPGLLLAVAAAAGLIPESVALALFAVSFVGLNLMHMGATWARVYVRPGWRSNAVERLLIPVALVVFALSFEAVGGGALLLAAQYFISFHHALMQNYGLVRASQRRSGRTVDVRLDLAACLLLPGAALLYRARAVCGEYSGAGLPVVPTPFIQALAITGAVALAAFAAREWLSYRRGETVDPIGIGMLFGTNLMWSAMLVLIAHPAIPLFALASGHYAQYIYFVRRVEIGDRPAASSNPLRAWLQSGLRSSTLRYLLLLFVLAAGVTLLLTFASLGLRAAAVSAGLRPEGALAIPVWAAAMLGVNLEHYWLDRRIWRSRRPAVAAA
jgi:hypothetical protein